jgi:putative SOS response-associated peptidase YedK
MCGRYLAARGSYDYAAAFDAEPVEHTDPDWNVAPGKRVPVVVEEQGERLLVQAVWGPVAVWGGASRRLFNARIETARQKAVFARALSANRCILPADGYYEWAHGVPHLVRPPDATPLALAGIAVPGGDPADPGRRAVVILTGGSAGRHAWLHDRSPLVVPPGAWDAWLRPDPPDAALLAALAPAVTTALPPRAVSMRLGSVTANGPGLLDPEPTLF